MARLYTHELRPPGVSSRVPVDKVGYDVIARIGRLRAKSKQTNVIRRKVSIMIVTMDGNRVTGSMPENGTLEALIERTGATLGPHRMLVAVRLNGKLLDEAGLDSTLKNTLSDSDQVDLESGSRQEVAVGALRGVADNLRDAGDTVGDVSQQLNNGQIDDAMKQIAAFIGLWQTTRTAIVQCCTVLSRDLTREHVDGQPISDRFGELATRLTELRDAMQTRDFVLVSDLLFYEMPTLCGEWSDMLRQLADVIERDEE
ncbi:MAG: hypothetical protein JNG88_17630 [Phycisphaerales bacterium]|nr:hypothetical protein [Phycisphaerales bacterium]